LKTGSCIEDRWGDLVVRGEGELTTPEIEGGIFAVKVNWPDIKGITYLDENGNIVRNPDRPFIQDLDKLPFPDPDLLVKKPRYPSYQIVTGRGCPFHCTFCAEGIRWC
jgi:radical SAM superfamily enzyme YgiQ (UPF0313 family)